MALPYHFNVIYNDAKSPLSSTPDTRLSFEFTELLVRKCDPHRWRSYYKDRDLLPGQNIFDELIKVIKGSNYVIIILTEGFVSDCWSTYQKHTALSMLIKEKRVDKIIPILIGVDTPPDDLGSSHAVSFSMNKALWESDESEQAWNKLIQRLQGEDTCTSADGHADGHAHGAQVVRSEQGDASRVVAQPTATIEMNNPVTSSLQQTSISLSESPIVRPPPSITPSQPRVGPIPGQNSFANVHSDHTAESTSTSRQFSLSQDQDLQSDFISAGAEAKPLVSPGTDSGFCTVDSTLSASNISICTITPDSSVADDFINHKNDGESLTETSVADTEVINHSTELYETTDQPNPVNTQGKDDTKCYTDILNTDSKNEYQGTDEVTANVSISVKKPTLAVKGQRQKSEADNPPVYENRDNSLRSELIYTREQRLNSTMENSTQVNTDVLDIGSNSECQGTDSTNDLMTENKPSFKFEEEMRNQNPEEHQAHGWLDRDRLVIYLSIAIPFILYASWLIKRRLGL